MPQPDARTRPFADVLRDLNRGRTHTELSEAMQSLVAAVVETGRKGTLTLTVTISPTGDDGAVKLTDQLAVKTPSFDRAASLFYVDDEHNLSRTDPRQLEMPGLRDVSAAPDPIAVKETQQ